MNNVDQSGAIPTMGIFNLKKAQQTQKVGIVFKNHQKRWARISPENKKESYGPGDQMKFKMKGQGVDYINFESTFLMMKVKVKADTDFFLNGSHDLIYRQQTRSGAFNLEDVIEANRFLTMEFMGSVHGKTTDGYQDNFAQIGIGSATPVGLTTTAKWIKVPFRTILDAGDYIPVFQLAESLDLVFTLNTTIKTLVSAANDYEITDVYMLADGLVAANNSVLDNTPYKFPSVAILNFVDQLPDMKSYLSDTATLQKTFTHDIKKTSLKKWLAGFFSDTKNTIIADGWDTNNLDTRKYPLSMDSSAIEFSMGGILYPYINGLDSKQLMWTEVQRYYHLLENTIPTVATRWLQYEKTWFQDSTKNGDDTYLRHYSAIYTACFDRLNQRNDVVSGIDTERYDVNVTFKGLKGEVADNAGTLRYLPIMYLVSFYIYNIMITIIGGEIKIED